jgi:hypothetical protein
VNHAKCDDQNECTTEVCDPAAGGCVYTNLPLSTDCGMPATGICAKHDHCDGLGNCVPNYQPPTLLCRDAVNDCDVAEFCTGASADCPPDACRPFGTACADGDGNECTNGACDGDCHCVPTNKTDGTACGNLTPKGVCDLGDICIAGVCNPNLLPGGTLCREALNECDIDERCTGASVDCPPDVCDPVGTACNDGDGNECTNGGCNGMCGSGVACVPSNKANGTACGNQTPLGDCDNPNICIAGSCNENLDPAGTLCREALNECDIEERCTGSSPACPPDLCDAPGTGCTDDGNECTNDVCNGTCGTAVACTHPNKSNGTGCGNSRDTVCDNPDTCVDGMCKPNFEPPTFVCRAAVNECDLAENCTGSSADCPPNLCDPSGTACGDDGNRCTNDVCDGVCGSASSPSCTHTDNNRCGACCLKDGSGECVDFVFREECPHPELKFFLKGRCSEINCNEVSIPTLSEWGLVVLTLLTLVGAKLYFGRRPAFGDAVVK